MPQRMSPQDASFLHIEDANNHMHIASVAIFEGPPPAVEDVRRMIEGKLPLIPRYRQKVRFVPLDLGRPVWVDDPHFNICFHVRHTALPSPGGEAELRNLVGRVMSQQLDRQRPLWESWVVEGLEDGHWALLSKTHHCMVDGVSGTDLLTVVLDKDVNPDPAIPDSWRPAPEPTRVELVAQALAERAINPYEMVRSARSALRAPRQAVETLRETVGGVASMRNVVRAATPAESTLVGPIGPHRRYAWARTQLRDVKTVKSALGGTVNDVVLAVITNGFRELLLGRGENVENRVVRSLVPVSVRRPGEKGTYNNRVSAMFADLPVGIADPVERLASIRAQMNHLKDSKQAVAGEVLTSLQGFAPPVLLAMGTRLAARLPQRNINTVTTNVPGPQQQLYAAGRPMVEAFPYVPLMGWVRIGVAIFSYLGGLTFGVTGDYDTAEDIDVLCRGVESGLADLVKEAEAVGRTSPESTDRRER